MLENNLGQIRPAKESSDALASEALAWMPSLVTDLKEQARSLALGGPNTFVNREFGSPMIVDEKTGQVITSFDSARSLPDRDIAANPAVEAAGTEHGVRPKDGGNQAESKAAPISMSEKGEIINRDVEPATSYYTKGENLSQIARDHLGPGASEDDVKKHVAEIARINGIKYADRPLEGRPLSLPGHTADGGFVTADADGNKRTIWHDGRVRVQNNGNSGYELTPDGHGNDRIHHWGSDPKDHTYFIKQADGTYLVADGKDDLQGHRPKDTHEELLVERARLINAADQKISDPEERARFRKDVQGFEERMNKRLEQANAVTDQLVADGKLTAEEATQRRAKESEKIQQELAGTFKETSRLLEAKDNPKLPIDERQRVILAEQIMHQSAQPSCIDQGHHTSCAVASLEARTYSLEPSKAAKIVVDAATEGQYRVSGPPERMIQLDPKSIRADFEAVGHPIADGLRSHASQLFQVVAVDSYFATNSYDYFDAAGRQHHAEPGAIRFEQRDPIPGQKPMGTGERLMDYSKTPPIEVHQQKGLNEFSGLNLYQLKAVNEQLLGGQGRDLALTRAIDPQYIARVTDENDRKELERRNADSNMVKDENGLGKELERLKAEGKLPVIVKVHTDHYPFHPAKADEAGGVGGTHLVTVTDYNPATGEVKIDNQWGSKWDLPDRKVSKRDLFEAMQEPNDPSHLARLEDEVRANRQGNNVDFLKETQLLRLKRGAKMLDDKALSAEIEDRYKAFLLKEKSDVTGSNVDRDKMVRAEFSELRAKLSRAEQQKLDARMKAFAKANNITLS